MRFRFAFIPAAISLLLPGLSRAVELGGLKETAIKANIDIDKQSDITASLASIIQFALSFVGVLFLIMLIWGGTVWMTAAGNQENIKKARGIVVAAVIGLVITLSAYAITQFIGTSLK